MFELGSGRAFKFEPWVGSDRVGSGRVGSGLRAFCTVDIGNLKFAKKMRSKILAFCLKSAKSQIILKSYFKRGYLKLQEAGIFLKFIIVLIILSKF